MSIIEGSWSLSTNHERFVYKDDGKTLMYTGKEPVTATITAKFHNITSGDRINLVIDRGDTSNVIVVSKD